MAVTVPQAVPFGIATRSLGRSAAGHYLPEILRACANAGLWTIEVAYECVEGYAKTLPSWSQAPQDALRESAKETGRIARELGLALSVLDAFEGYDGGAREKHPELVETFRFWVELCGLMGIEHIQVPANFDPAALGGQTIVDDLRELADIGLSVTPSVKIAYEPMGWCTHVATWEKALDVIREVQRPNIGLCLDTYHIASLLWASPRTEDGLREGGEDALSATLERLRRISKDDIILLQLSDGEKLSPPMPTSKYTDPKIDDLFAWSIHGRPFPGEGYFPVERICAAIFATGFRGITVMETFEDQTYETRKSLLAERASRAVESWVGLSKSLGLAPFHPPAAKGSNKLGTCTVNLGHYEHYTLEDKLYAAAAVGHQAIDLYEDDWLYHLSLQQGANKADLWEPSPAHLAAAKNIGDLCASLGMEIICFQPLIDVEGLVGKVEREDAVKRVKAYFPFMRALRTTVTYITTNRRYDFDNISGDIDAIAKDLAYFADLAVEYSQRDGGPMLKIGYEHLSWGSHINTFDKCWEAIKRADRPNLGFVFDTFNFLAVEYANPYHAAGHGCLHATPEESLKVVRERLARLAKLIPGDKIYVCQVADAKLVDPKSLPVPTPSTEAWSSSHEPPIRAWSSSHRLFPNERALGGYMPVAESLAAILATGYKGAFTLEVFNDSLFENGPEVVASHAIRAYEGVKTCVDEAKGMAKLYA